MTLTLKIVNQFYCKTHCLMIIHHHTEFGKKKKWLSGSGDTEQTWLDTWRKISGQTFTDILNLHCDVDLEHSNPIFPQDTPAYDAVLSNQVGCKLTSTLEGTTEIVIFGCYKLSLWPWHWTQWTNFFCMTLWITMLHNHTRFGDKMPCGSEDIVRTNIS